MNTQQHFKRLFTYDDWANRETLASIVAAGDPPARTLSLMSHILAAGRLWLARLKGESVSVVVWPDLSVDECSAQLDELSASWREYLAGLTEESISGPISYVNSKGDAFTNSVEEILSQVGTHGGYHRGQIAILLRDAGCVPAATDFIVWARRGA